MIDDTPCRKLIKINQEKENDKLPELINENIISQEILPLNEQICDDDLTRKVEECFRNNNEQQTDVDMMEIDEINNNNNNKQKSSTRRRSRFRFSFSNNQNSNEEEEKKSRLSRTYSASIINPENLNQMNPSRRRKSYSTTGLAAELKNIPNEQITNVDKVFYFK